MRTAVKYRLVYLVIAIACYSAGFAYMPEQLSNTFQYATFIGFASAYFLILPVLYWFWVIKAGQQKAWKILVCLSLSCLVARFSFPADFAHYFEFIAWLRYPIIAIFILIELVVIVSVVRGLWQARHLKGDPRISAFNGTKDKKDETQALAMTLAYEPASWYYAIPFLSRKHTPSLTRIPLLSASRWHLIFALILLVLASAGSYLGLRGFSETLALVVSSLIFYGIILLFANYRVSRHFSVYRQEEQLMLNNSIWGFVLADLAHIETIELGEWDKADNKEALFFGRGKANIRIGFSQEQRYVAAVGQLSEPVQELFLRVEDTSVVMALKPVAEAA